MLIEVCTPSLPVPFLPCQPDAQRGGAHSPPRSSQIRLLLEQPARLSWEEYREKHKNQLSDKMGGGDAEQAEYRKQLDEERENRVPLPLTPNPRSQPPSTPGSCSPDAIPWFLNLASPLTWRETLMVARVTGSHLSVRHLEEQLVEQHGRGLSQSIWSLQSPTMW